MSKEQYDQRREIIMQKIYRHSKTDRKGRPCYPRCLEADYRELEKLDKEYQNDLHRQQ